MEIYKDKSGVYWIDKACDTLRDVCGEFCEGCSLYALMQELGQAQESQEGCYAVLEAASHAATGRQPVQLG